MKKTNRIYSRFLLLCAAVLAIPSAAACVFLLVSGAVALCVGFLILTAAAFAIFCYVISQFFHQPFLTFLAKIQDLADGNDCTPIEIEESNELQAAADAFNKLLEQNRKSREELSLYEQRYQIVTALSDDTLFEYDVEENTICDSTDWHRKSSGLRFLRGTVTRGIVHPDDAPLFTNFFESLISGKATSLSQEMRLRLTPGSDDYSWVICRAVTVFSEDGKPRKVIGKRSNIDRQKREAETLRKKAMRDPLTGLSNKETTGALIEQVLEEQSDAIHAVMLFDIDDFKSVNDNLGHLFGDAVLSDISSKISSLFRSTDVVGRVGGDEFLVCMRNITHEAVIRKKAEEMCAVFRQSYTGHKKDYKISGSIGIALYPRDGTTYRDLVSNADLALYFAKESGKDQYQFFDASLSKPHYKKADRGEPADQEPRALCDNLSSYIFDILYETADVENAIRMILGIVGRYYNVSRVYVIEQDENDGPCHNTFEWRNSNAPSDLIHACHTPFLALSEYKANFNREHIFYCGNVSSLPSALSQALSQQGIHSLLQCLVLDGDKVRGYVGFDECRATRLWTNEEIETLSFISKVLSAFLLKLRAQDKQKAMLQSLRQILDSQDCITYVVEPQDYRLLFLNQKAKSMDPQPQLGEICYKKFMGRESPCGLCPIAEKRGPYNTSKEVYHPAYKIWTRSTVCPIQWVDGAQVYLISCTDITPYQDKQLNHQNGGIQPCSNPNGNSSKAEPTSAALPVTASQASPST